MSVLELQRSVKESHKGKSLPPALSSVGSIRAGTASRSQRGPPSPPSPPKANGNRAPSVATAHAPPTRQASRAPTVASKSGGTQRSPSLDNVVPSPLDQRTVRDLRSTPLPNPPAAVPASVRPSIYHATAARPAPIVEDAMSERSALLSEAPDKSLPTAEDLRKRLEQLLREPALRDSEAGRRAAESLRSGKTGRIAKELATAAATIPRRPVLDRERTLMDIAGDAEVQENELRAIVASLQDQLLLSAQHAENAQTRLASSSVALRDAHAQAIANEVARRSIQEQLARERARAEGAREKAAVQKRELSHAEMIIQQLQLAREEAELDAERWQRKAHKADLKAAAAGGKIRSRSSSTPHRHREAPVQSAKRYRPRERQGWPERPPYHPAPYLDAPPRSAQMDPYLDPGPSVSERHGETRHHQRSHTEPDGNGRVAGIGWPYADGAASAEQSGWGRERAGLQRTKSEGSVPTMRRQRTPDPLPVPTHAPVPRSASPPPEPSRARSIASRAFSIMRPASTVVPSAPSQRLAPYRPPRPGDGAALHKSQYEPPGWPHVHPPSDVGAHSATREPSRLQSRVTSRAASLGLGAVPVGYGGAPSAGYASPSRPQAESAGASAWGGAVGPARSLRTVQEEEEDRRSAARDEVRSYRDEGRSAHSAHPAAPPINYDSRSSRPLRPDDVRSTRTSRTGATSLGRPLLRGEGRIEELAEDEEDEYEEGARRSVGHAPSCGRPASDGRSTRAPTAIPAITLQPPSMTTSSVGRSPSLHPNQVPLPDSTVRGGATTSRTPTVRGDPSRAPTVRGKSMSHARPASERTHAAPPVSLAAAASLARSERSRPPASPRPAMAMPEPQLPVLVPRMEENPMTGLSAEERKAAFRAKALQAKERQVARMAGLNGEAE